MSIQAVQHQDTFDPPVPKDYNFDDSDDEDSEFGEDDWDPEIYQAVGIMTAMGGESIGHVEDEDPQTPPKRPASTEPDAPRKKPRPETPNFDSIKAAEIYKSNIKEHAAYLDSYVAGLPEDERAPTKAKKLQEFAASQCVAINKLRTGTCAHCNEGLGPAEGVSISDPRRKLFDNFFCIGCVKKCPECASGLIRLVDYWEGGCCYACAASEKE
jgi:hypothetical protein